MSVELKLTFPSMDELRAYLSITAEAPAPAAVVEAAPVPDNIVEIPDPVGTPMIDDVDPIAPPAEEPVPTPAADTEVLRTELMTRLRDMAGSMDDPSVLGKFINGFGVARFSDIADEDLVGFKAALEAEFGA